MEGGRSGLTFREYQEQARRTQNPNLSPREQLEHALWGLAAEVGEGGRYAL